MVFVREWRRGVGGGRGEGVGEIGARRDARTLEGILCGVICVRGMVCGLRNGGGPRAPRAAGGCTSHLLCRYRCATLSCCRGAYFQPLSRRNVSELLRRRLSAVSSQYYTPVTVHRATRR